VRVHLVDGSVEMFRCFYGAPRAEDALGREVGAVRGFLATMIALIRRQEATHLAVAFDSVVAPARGAASESDLLTSQFPLAAEACRAMGILIWPMVRFQADDALATGAALYKDLPGVEQVVICSTDNDFAQCVEGTRVVLLNRIRKVTTDEAAVQEKFGVAPGSIPDYLALVGDVSDGLPGIPGWGRKSVGALLTAYPKLEDIPEDCGSWTCKVRGAERLSASLRDRWREALLYRNLSILRTDVPLPDELHHLEWRGARRDRLPDFAAEIGAEEVLERISLWQ
jgi:5'-3' exonuclease